MDAVIEARSLGKRIWRTAIVTDVSFNVRAGEILGFLGPNGAGKTSTIRMLLGLSRPSTGDALLCGRPVRGRRSISVGSMVDAPGLFPWLSAAQNMELLCPRSTSDSRRRELARVGLAEVGQKKVKAFSQGMKQRLALAVAIGNGPAGVILDEPMNGLDPAGIREFRTILADLASEGRAVLLSSHQLSEVERTCHRVVILDRGRVVAEDSFAEASSRFLVQLSKHDMAAAVRALSQFEVVAVDEASVVLHADSGRKIALALNSAGLVAEAIQPARTSLEDKFLQLTDQGDPR